MKRRKLISKLGAYSLSFLTVDTIPPHAPAAMPSPPCSPHPALPTLLSPPCPPLHALLTLPSPPYPPPPCSPHHALPTLPSYLQTVSPHKPFLPEVAFCPTSNQHTIQQFQTTKRLTSGILDTKSCKCFMPCVVYVFQLVFCLHRKWNPKTCPRSPNFSS